MVIYNMQEYIDDLKAQILLNKYCYTGKYLNDLNNMSMVQLENELKSVSEKSYRELTGNKIGF